MLLFVAPGRRYRTAIGLWLVCLLSFVMGCGGGGAGISSGGGPPSQTATVTKLTAPTTKASQGTSLSFNVSVTASGATPAGMVQLFDGTTALGSPVQLANGSATIGLNSLAVGTHQQISAHYLGDTNTLASQSGALSVTVTGSTNVFLQSVIGGVVASGNISLTIN
jgi:Bacterial Ig-like domain (group 3)